MAAGYIQTLSKYAQYETLQIYISCKRVNMQRLGSQINFYTVKFITLKV